MVNKYVCMESDHWSIRKKCKIKRKKYQIIENKYNIKWHEMKEMRKNKWSSDWVWERQSHSLHTEKKQIR